MDPGIVADSVHVVGIGECEEVEAGTEIDAACKRGGDFYARAEGAGSEAPWPDLGRVTRECMQIAFSNERARTVLGWRPRYGLPTGAAVTRSWLEAAGLLSGES